MLEGEGPEPVPVERGSQVVVGEGEILDRRREPALESREVEDRLPAVLIVFA